MSPSASERMAEAPVRHSSVRVATRSEKQAMDWSLALASQDIPCVIHAPAEASGWWLEIDGADSARALRTLRTYHEENRGGPRLPPEILAAPSFHWGVLLWCALMALVFLASTAPQSTTMTAASFDTARTASGQWWRPLTATFLHHDPEHLAANLTAGFLLLGLAMGRLGVGVALLTTLVAGSLGNLFAWALRPHAYIGLGASGVVMAALGLLALTTSLEARTSSAARGMLLRGSLGGALLFVLLGTSARSDVLAHAGGFLFGAAAAGALILAPRALTRSPRFDTLCALAYAVVSLAGWLAAMRFG